MERSTYKVAIALGWGRHRRWALLGHSNGRVRPVGGAIGAI